MPIPRHATDILSVPIAPEADSDAKVTELRVHGVGGTPPDALLADLAPTQVAGDRIAGFYRTTDYAIPGGASSKRHVECYSWGGLTSRSKSRVLWLALLPFLLGNLAGWMCSPKMRAKPWRFALHRASATLGALALTVNATLVAVMITADVLAYQTVRGGLAGNQWWLAPLRLPEIAGHPARQVLVGVLVPGMFILILALLGRTSRKRYEAVHPPFEGKEEPGLRPVPASAAREGGLAADGFWAGEASVRLLGYLHIAAAVGFLAVVLGVTARTLVATQTQWLIWWYVAVCAGGAVMALAVAYLCADAAGAIDGLAGVFAKDADEAGKHRSADRLRNTSVILLVIVAAIAAVSAGLFAWLQPGGTPEKAAGLPGMTGVIIWTAVAIGVPVVVLGLHVLTDAVLERAGASHRLFGGPLVVFALAFSVLNVVLLGVLIWVAHIVGSVTTDSVAAVSASPGQIYVPQGIAFGIPLIALAAVVAGAVFALVELGRWWWARPVPGDDVCAYRNGAIQKLRDIDDAELKPWYWSALLPAEPSVEAAAPGRAVLDGRADRATNPSSGQAGAIDPPSGQAAEKWPRTIARAQWLGRAPHDAAWLLWGVVLLQLAAAICTWRFRWYPPVAIRNAGTFAAVALVTPLMAYLYSAWSRPDRRRQIAVLWDVGTFWPRSYHPFSPPSYAERAVPDLQRRMWWLHNHHGPVVLVAHSQGAMLAVAALVQQAHRPKHDQVALVTFGAPICKLYSWGFPAYIAPALLTPLARGDGGRGDKWVNFYYPTDPIGGPVTLTAKADTVDQRLLDPAECWYIYGQPLPAPQGHSGYWADQRVLNCINKLAMGLGGGNGEGEKEPAGAPAGPGLVR